MKTRIIFLAALLATLLAAAAPAEEPDDRKCLIGRWDQHNLNDAPVGNGYVRFFKDGTFRWARPKKGLIEGHYRVLEGGALEFNLFPTRHFRWTGEYKYALGEDEKGKFLRLKLGAGWVSYRRSKKQPEERDEAGGGDKRSDKRPEESAGPGKSDSAAKKTGGKKS